MENSDIFLLLRFAQVIQQKIKTEKNEDARNSLEKDLILIKDEIGKRVLNIPNDSPIFPPFDSSLFIDENSLDASKEYQQSHQSSIIGSPINSPSRSNKASSIQMLSEIIDENSQKSNNYLEESMSIEENSIYSFPGQPNSLVDYTADDIAAKFNKFIQQKELNKNKVSRIQKQKSKIPIPKQK